MVKIRKFGRRFLTTNPNNTDAVFWSASFLVEGWRPHPAWRAALGIVMGRTCINIHSSNEDNDVEFVQFLKKLDRLQNAIKEFIEQMAEFRKSDKEFESKRTWLNDDEPGTFYFNGYVATSFSKNDFNRITLADCHRTIIFDFDNREETLKWAIESNGTQMERLETILEEIEEMRVNIDAVIREASKIDTPVKKKKKGKIEVIHL